MLQDAQPACVLSTTRIAPRLPETTVQLQVLLDDPEKALSAPLRKALHRAARAVKSQSGKALLRKRGMHLERSFEHVLDEGGLRRATLKGTENLTKRYKIAAACFNLSLLMRSLLGVGTRKQWMAGASSLLAVIPYLCWGVLWFRSLCVRTPTFILVFPNLLRTQVAA